MVVSENHYQQVRETLQQQPKKWLVTGAAGFIGSNLVQALLQLGQQVVGLDNFITGKRANLIQVAHLVGAANWRQFQLLEGDIRDIDACLQAARGIDYILHQAALGSVPRSLEDPLNCHRINVDGFVHMLEAARQAQVQRLVYASSSAVYGDSAATPKRESDTGQALSPYALSKQVNERYAAIYQNNYHLSCIGLRYFNVYGPRQDPAGAYAAVIPRWIQALRQGQPLIIYGDGETSRDFSFVENIVQANLLAATTQQEGASGEVYNIGVGQQTSLADLAQLLRQMLPTSGEGDCVSVYQPFRAGDVRHSHADIRKAESLLAYHPTHSVERGLRQTLAWYCAQTAVSG